MRDGIVPGWPALIVGRGGPPGIDGPLTPGKLTFLPSAALVPTAADELSAPVLAAGASFFKRRKTTTPRLPKRRGALGQAHKVATGWQTRDEKTLVPPPGSHPKTMVFVLVHRLRLGLGRRAFLVPLDPTTFGENGQSAPRGSK
jgi:hypothetical protein